MVNVKSINAASFHIYYLVTFPRETLPMEKMKFTFKVISLILFYLISEMSKRALREHHLLSDSSRPGNSYIFGYE